MVKLYDCGCEWEKDPDVKVGKGYRLKTMCDSCQQAMNRDQELQAQFEANAKKELKINEKLRDMAIKELEKEGKWP